MSVCDCVFVCERESLMECEGVCTHVFVNSDDDGARESERERARESERKRASERESERERENMSDQEPETARARARKNES